MRWATRRGCHVDRAACAWLIRRFIDPDATFAFVTDPDDVSAGATPFDMRGVEYGGDLTGGHERHFRGTGGQSASPRNRL